MSVSASQSTGLHGTEPCVRRGGWRLIWRAALVAAVLATAWLAYPHVLPLAGGLLVVDEPCSDFSHVLLGGGDHRFDIAAELYRKNPSRRLVLIEPCPSRLVRNGIIPSFENICRRELNARGVPNEAVELIPGEARNAWAAARLLRQWISDHPDARLLVLCNRFASRRQRSVLDAVLGPEDAARVFIRGLPDRRYHETNWWQSRCGAREFVFGSLALAYLWCRGEGREDPQQWNPDDYERMLCRTAADASP